MLESTLCLCLDNVCDAFEPDIIANQDLTDLSAFLFRLYIFNTVYLEYNLKNLLYGSLRLMSAQSCVLSENTASRSNSELLIVLWAKTTFKNTFNDVKVLVLSKKWITKQLWVIQSRTESYRSHVETFIQNNRSIQVYPEAFGNSPANSSNHKQKWYLCSVVTNTGSDSETLWPIVLFKNLFY